MPRQGSAISAPVTSRCSCLTKQMKCSTGADGDTSATTRTSILFEENKGFRRWYLYINCVQSTVLYAVCLTWSHMFFFAGHDDVFYSDYVVPYGSGGDMLTKITYQCIRKSFQCLWVGTRPMKYVGQSKAACSLGTSALNTRKVRKYARSISVQLYRVHGCTVTVAECTRSWS